ncbi:MAG TPA: Mur ligase family protein [Candidatus Saccharimonadales bacterium]
MNRELELHTFDEVDKALLPYVPLVSELTGKDKVLDRIEPLMEFLGNPHDQLKTIHIAGTSGKTSTAYYVSSILTKTGMTIGLSVSPHIDRLSERAQINGECLSEQVFCMNISEFLSLVEDSGVKPSYFELMYAFAIWLFAKYKVDYAVIETGMGGLFDATNIVDREDKICVITDIGFDHMHILGHSLREITKQKVGIIHKGNVLLVYKQADEVMNEVNLWIKQVNAGQLLLTNEKEQLDLYGKGDNFENLPEYQKRNWLLAYFVFRFIKDRDGLDELTQNQVEASQLIVIPARMDEIKISDRIMIMDGAHNYQKMKAFVSSFKLKYPGIKPDILLSFKKGKDYIKALPLLSEIANKIILTTFETSQDLPVSSIEPSEVADSLAEIGFNNIMIEPDMHKAYQLLLSSGSNVVLVTGSFYLISQLRRNELNFA